MRWKTAKNGYLYDLLLPWQQSGIHSYELKIIPALLLIFTANARNLNPKFNQIVHSKFFIFL